MMTLTLSSCEWQIIRSATNWVRTVLTVDNDSSYADLDARLIRECDKIDYMFGDVDGHYRTEGYTTEEIELLICYICRAIRVIDDINLSIATTLIEYITHRVVEEIDG